MPKTPWKVRNLETRIYNQQFTRIRRECGEEAADRANYGWGVIGDEDTLDVSTKVYGEGVLRSVGNRLTGDITHEWR